MIWGRLPPHTQLCSCRVDVVWRSGLLADGATTRGAGWGVGEAACEGLVDPVAVAAPTLTLPVPGLSKFRRGSPRTYGLGLLGICGCSRAQLLLPLGLDGRGHGGVRSGVLGPIAVG